MRVTGSGDPRRKIEETLPGKLPQRKITVGAAHGYSSYGNQIGLATGMVSEIYDEGYVAKRMEIGAVIGATPRSHVVRGTPKNGDAILLLGGRTGRDGCGGATGSSKEHTEQLIATCSAEVQKGNPPTERKIQRLFRAAEASRLIKKCNDFGAGGVSVAIGELAEGVDINLDAVPKKYGGLDGTELAISESQERMAVVVAPESVERFIELAHHENLEATRVATVTGDRRLRMRWRGKAIVDLSRDFIDTNGVRQTAAAAIAAPSETKGFFTAPSELAKRAREDLSGAWMENLGDLNVCSQRGLGERFDSSIGAGSVLMPFGGESQNSPAECMVAKLPVLRGATTTGTAMSHGFNPGLSRWSPFHGAVYAIVEAVARIVAVGGDYRRVKLTLQEYFEKLGADSAKWGRPVAALLGAFHAQRELGIAAIGGKDSMSGSFKHLSVPPTLVAFAVAPVEVDKIISSAFLRAGSQIALISAKRDAAELPDFEAMRRNYLGVRRAIELGQVLSASVVRAGGLAGAISRMAFGNKLGASLRPLPDGAEWFAPNYGSLVIEAGGDVDLAEALPGVEYEVVGRTVAEPELSCGGARIPLGEALRVWSQPLEKVFPRLGAVTTADEIPPGYESGAGEEMQGPSRPAPSIVDSISGHELRI